MELVRAENLARDLMDQHGLTAQGWTFAFDTAVKRFGSCNFGRKRVTLSRELTSRNTEEHVLDTILHEIAHALAGPGAGHGPAWKAKAAAVGCSPQRCYDSLDVVTVEPRYLVECPCGAGHRGKERISRRHTYRCRRCGEQVTFRKNPARY